MTQEQDELLNFFELIKNEAIMEIKKSPELLQHLVYDIEMGTEREVHSMLNMPGAQPKCKTQKCEPTPINPGHRCDLNDLNKCNKSDAD